MRWVVRGGTSGVLWSADSWICLKQYIAFLCSSHLVFSLCVLLVSMGVYPYNSMDTGIA